MINNILELDETIKTKSVPPVEFYFHGKLFWETGWKQAGATGLVQSFGTREDWV
jgi:hypothetical protein